MSTGYHFHLSALWSGSLRHLLCEEDLATKEPLPSLKASQVSGINQQTLPFSLNPLKAPCPHLLAYVLARQGFEGQDCTRVEGGGAFFLLFAFLSSLCLFSPSSSLSDPPYGRSQHFWTDSIWRKNFWFDFWRPFEARRPSPRLWHELSGSVRRCQRLMP